MELSFRATRFLESMLGVCYAWIEKMVIRVCLAVFKE